MRAIKSLETCDRTVVRVGEELRKSVRFRIFNSWLKIGDSQWEIFDISSGGISLKCTQFEPGTKLIAQWIWNNQRYPLEIEIKRKGKEYSGAVFLSEVSFLDDIIDATSFSQESFKLQVSSITQNSLIYKNSTGNIVLGFHHDDCGFMKGFFFTFQNAFLNWKEGSGISSGVLLFESSFEVSWSNEDSRQKDFIIDKNKIQLFKDIVNKNQHITESLKNWIYEKMEDLVL